MDLLLDSWLRSEHRQQMPENIVWNIETMRHKLRDPDSSMETDARESYVDILRRFYEAAVTLSILGPVANAQRTRSDLRMNGKASRPPWHKFLDHLCWLCDYKCGGKTVSSIAVSQADSDTVFNLTTNNQPTARAVDHLNWVLEQLKSLRGISDYEGLEVEHEIFGRSIQLSRKRVQDYAKRLRKHSRKAKSSLDRGLTEAGSYNVDSVT